MTDEVTDKVRENRIRRMAKRQGLLLQKSRRRDPLAADFGAYWLIRCRSAGAECRDTSDSHWRSHEIAVGNTEYGTDLDDIEAALTERSAELRLTLRETMQMKGTS